MRCGWDLGDLYSGRLSLRGLWVRVKALPHDSPLASALDEERTRAEQRERDAVLDDALTRYKPKG